MMRRLGGRGIAVAVSLGMLAAADGADAADLSRSGVWGENLTYVAAPGEANDVTIRWTTDVVTVTDPGASITLADSAAKTCRQTGDPHVVECDVTSPFPQYRMPGGLGTFDMGDGDDTARVVAPKTMFSDSTFDGGPGDDHLVGAGDDDKFVAGPGHDTYEPGGGAHNVLVYSGQDPIRIDRRIPGAAPDGEIIPDGIQGIVTGPGDDVLVGGDADESFVSWGGNDRIEGNGGDDVIEDGPGDGSTDGPLLDGGPGDDTLRGYFGEQRLNGGPGADLLTGGDGADDLRGGPGLDLVSYASDDVAPGSGDFAAAVTASIGDGPNDGSAQDTGPAGARDDIHADVEGLRGTSGKDRLTGDDGPNFFDPGYGEDFVDGRDGDDFVAPAPERYDGVPDHVEGGGGNDVLTVHSQGASADGGDGDDVLVTGYGPAGGTRLLGGLGRDRLYGGGWGVVLDAGPGDDSVRTQDHSASDGTCGDGNDEAMLDDPDGKPVAVPDQMADCETIARLDPVDSRAVASVARGDGDPTALGGYGERVEVRTPRSGPVLIEVLGHVDGPLPKPAAVPLQVDVRAPEPAPGDVISSRFLLFDRAVPESVDPASVGVYLDGVPLDACVGEGVPAAGACVASRDRVDSYPQYEPVTNDLEIVVRSTRGGRFTFSRPVIEVPEPPIEPGPAPSPDPGPGPGPGVPSDEAAPRLRMQRIGATSLRSVTSKGLLVPLECSEHCTATTQLVIGGRDAKRLRLAAVIGRSRTSIDGRRTVRVKVTRAAARRLRRAKSLRLTVRASAVDAAGNRSNALSSSLRLR
jgi:Ca2+-binding RTX toxin-like protein